MAHRKGDMIGQMRRRMQVWSSVTTTNSMNEPTGGKDTLLSTRWTKVDMKKGAEIEKDGVIYESDLMVFTTRYNSTLDDQTHIIVYRGSDYDIRSIEILEEMDRYMIIEAEKRV